MVHKGHCSVLNGMQTGNQQLISIRIAEVPKNITIIQAYAPTSSHSEQDIDSFYEELEAFIMNTPKSDILIIQGDWNAKVGTDAQPVWAETTGKFGFGDSNDCGLTLLEFARYHNLVLSNTLHSGKSSRQVTWHAPNRIDKSQIDYILFPKRFLSGIKTSKTRAFPGANVESDHELVMMTIKIKQISMRRQRNPRVKYNSKTPGLCRNFKQRFEEDLLHYCSSKTNRSY